MTEKHTKHNNRMLKCLLAMMAVLFAAAMILVASASNTYAADETPIREAHKISIPNKGTYCLFVTHNVVLTPEDILKMKEEIDKDNPEASDEEKRNLLRDELNDKILKDSGLYLKETNCKSSSHKAISIENWNKNDKNIKITLKGYETKVDPSYVDYIDNLIDKAQDTDDPIVDGSPLILSMTLRQKGTAGENALLTIKVQAEELILVGLASEKDAKEQGESVCEEEKKPEKKKKSKTPKVTPSKEKEDMLPEMRTIPMTKRAGDPLRATLEDGSPVTLEWIEPGSEPENDLSFWDRIPGGILTPIALLLGLLLLLILLLKRRKQDDSE